METYFNTLFLPTSVIRAVHTYIHIFSLLINKLYKPHLSHACNGRRWHKWWPFWLLFHTCSDRVTKCPGFLAVIFSPAFKILKQYLTVPHSASQYLTVPHSASQYLTVTHSASQYLTVPHSTSQYLTVPHSTSQYLTFSHANSTVIFTILLSPYYLNCITWATDSVVKKDKSVHAYYISCRNVFPWFHHPRFIGGKFMLQESSIGNCILQTPVTCAILGPNILLSMLFSTDFRSVFCV